MIVQGNGLVKVTATALNTEIGKIGKALESVKEEPTQLKSEMGILVKRLAIIGILLCILVIAMYTITRGDLIKRFSGRNYPCNGNAARGISGGFNHFPCSWSMENVEKISVNP